MHSVEIVPLNDGQKERTWYGLEVYRRLCYGFHFFHFSIKPVGISIALATCWQLAGNLGAKAMHAKTARIRENVLQFAAFDA